MFTLNGALVSLILTVAHMRPRIEALGPRCYNFSTVGDLKANTLVLDLSLQNLEQLETASRTYPRKSIMDKIDTL